jgi:hypothetical protein
MQKHVSFATSDLRHFEYNNFVKVCMYSKIDLSRNKQDFCSESLFYLLVVWMMLHSVEAQVTSKGLEVSALLPG